MTLFVRRLTTDRYYVSSWDLCPPEPRYKYLNLGELWPTPQYFDSLSMAIEAIKASAVRYDEIIVQETS